MLLNIPINGYMAKGINPAVKDSSFAQTRAILRSSWNTTSLSGSSNPNRMTGGFRAVNNAGDILSRQNYSCGGTCQAPQSIPNVHGLKNKIGGTSKGCMADVFWSSKQIDPTVPSSTCNVKYVYDCSDYIKYKQQLAMNRTYNDIKFGGDDYNGSQVAQRDIKLF